MSPAAAPPTSPRRLYIDTSAYPAMLLDEDPGARLSIETSGAELFSSVLLILETRRNLVRLAREGSLTPAQYKVCLDRVDADRQLFVLRDLTLDLCDSQLWPAVATPRSLDLAHLRTALWFHADARLTRFITLDESQAESASELGLPV